MNLIRAYYGTSYGENGPNTVACGWENLVVGQVIDGRPCPYRIDRYGTPIGWASLDAIQFI